MIDVSPNSLIMMGLEMVHTGCGRDLVGGGAHMPEGDPMLTRP